MSIPSIQDIQADITAVQAALLAPGAATLGTVECGIVFATLTKAQGDIWIGAGTAESYLASLVTLGATGDGVFAFDTAANGVLALNAATSLAAYLATSARAAAFLGRIAQNLANAST